MCYIKQDTAADAVTGGQAASKTLSGVFVVFPYPQTEDKRLYLYRTGKKQDLAPTKINPNLNHSTILHT